MAQHKKGDMFDAPGVHIVTANASISSDGTLVMGLGAALAFKKKYPDASKVFGCMVQEYCGHRGRYGLLLYGKKGILQTRADMQGKMDMDLIKYGLTILRAVAEGNPGTTYHLIHPGLSLNKTTMPEIDAILEQLPQNVWVWQK